MCVCETGRESENMNTCVGVPAHIICDFMLVVFVVFYLFLLSVEWGVMLFERRHIHSMRNYRILGSFSLSDQ